MSVGVLFPKSRSSWVFVFPSPWPFAWSPALALVLAPNLYLPALAPNLYLPALAHNLYLAALAPNLYLVALAPICIYWPCPPICIYQHWSPICIYQPWPTILLPVQDLTLHIPTLPPQFVFVFTTLAHYLYYRSGAWIYIYLIIGSSSSSSGSCDSSRSNFFGIDNTNVSRENSFLQVPYSENCIALYFNSLFYFLDILVL